MGFILGATLPAITEGEQAAERTATPLSALPAYDSSARIGQPARFRAVALNRIRAERRRDERRQELRRAARERAARRAAAASSVSSSPPSTSASGGGGGGAPSSFASAMECIGQMEEGGSNSTAGYFGFIYPPSSYVEPGPSLAAAYGDSWLAIPYSEQLRVAYALYELYGWSPWSTAASCGLG